MAYRKLSEQVMQLVNVQRSDSFVKMFRGAVRAGQIQGTYLPERFTLPKAFSRRGGASYSRQVKEMLFEVTPDFEHWFEQANRELAVGRRGGQIRPSLEAIQAGLVDFEALTADTRRKMQASFSKGQALGKSRARGKKA